MKFKTLCFALSFPLLFMPLTFIASNYNVRQVHLSKNFYAESNSSEGEYEKLGNSIAFKEKGKRFIFQVYRGVNLIRDVLVGSSAATNPGANGLLEFSFDPINESSNNGDQSTSSSNKDNNKNIFTRVKEEEIKKNNISTSFSQSFLESIKYSFDVKNDDYDPSKRYSLNIYSNLRPYRFVLYEFKQEKSQNPVLTDLTIETEYYPEDNYYYRLEETKL